MSNLFTKNNTMCLLTGTAAASITANIYQKDNDQGNAAHVLTVPDSSKDKEIEELKIDLAQADALRKQLTDENEELKYDLQQADQQRATLTEENESLKKQNKTLQNQSKELEQAHDNMEKQLNANAEQLFPLTKEVSNLKEQLKALQDENETLKQCSIMGITPLNATRAGTDWSLWGQGEFRCKFGNKEIKLKTIQGFTDHTSEDPLFKAGTEFVSTLAKAQGNSN